ncbi:MAG TPA: hypothetical protein VIY73_24125 [Polyangiaceae bacterium]
MKRFGYGVLGTGVVSLGWALSVGIVSIGMNAVGWIAIGLNAAGFVSVGLINSVGVFSFGGVNALGGWGSGGVNAGGGHWFGLAVSVAAVVGLLVARLRSWPEPGERLEVVPLGVAMAAHAGKARARLVGIGTQIVLRQGSTVVRPQATEGALRHAALLGRGTRVIATFKRAMQEVPGAGYRDDAAHPIGELVHVMADPDRGFVRTLFGGTLGINLALSIFGVASAVAAFFVWQ